jgi:SAM-dependent methyltransferase
VVNARLNAWVVLHSLKLSGIKTMLDVGTGYGFLLHEMGKRIQVDAVGVELSRQEATYAQNKLGLKVLNSSLAASGLHRGQYDLVTSFEVIEHIPDPLEFIAEMAQYVKIGGHLLLMTDNFESRMAGSLGAGFPKWIPHAHVSHFSPSTLKSAIEATDGLSLVHSMSYTPWEVFLRDAYYRLRGIKKTPSEAFNLTATLEGEMAGTYRLFRLRRLINRIWMKLALTDEMNGDLMYFLARKTA